MKVGDLVRINSPDCPEEDGLYVIARVRNTWTREVDYCQLYGLFGWYGVIRNGLEVVSASGREHV
jgi:hypothetical protein